MRAKISVRVSKLLHTLLRNMRRRRKTSSFPSSLPIVLLFGLIALLRTVNVSSISSAIHNKHKQPVTENTAQKAVYEIVPKEGVLLEKDVSSAKREQYMERRVAERRAMHRRIVENKRESAENSQQSVSQDSSEMVKEGDHNKTRSEGHLAEDTSSSGDADKSEADQGKDGGPSQEERRSESEEDSKSVKNAENNEVSSGTGENVNKTEGHSAVDGVPVGARVHGKLSEYGGSLGGSTDGMLRGQNITRVSYTLFKIMKLFGFVSMIDSPAGNHTEWMPELVERMSFDHPSFQYIGVDEDAESVARAKKAMGEVADGEYVVNNVEQAVANNSDVVFHWTELDGGEWDARNKGYMEHIRKVIVASKNGDNGYIIFGQYPRLNGPQPTYRKGKWVFEGDETEEPFLYNEHVRGVVPMGSGRESYMLYMTVYSLRSMPTSEFQV